MSFQLSVKDIHFLRPFFWYLDCFLITPWYDFRKKTLVKPNMRILYITILILSKITILVYSLLDETLGQVYAKLIYTQKIILGGIYTNTTLTLILTIFKTGIWDTNLWKEMFARFHFVDRKLKNQGKTETFLRNFYFKLFLKHVLSLMCGFYELYVWSIFMKIPLWKVFIFTGFMEVYYEFLLVSLVTALVQDFEARYKDLNEKIVITSKKGTAFPELLNLVQAYRILGETVEIFNQIFGHQLVLIIFHCGLQMVHCLNLVFVMGAVEIDEDTHLQFLMCNFYLLVWIGVSFIVHTIQ